jgi:hypothetical protein
MKKFFEIVLIAVILCFSGSAASEGGKNYSALAKEKN